MNQKPDIFTIGLAGQPNVGKSTIFNSLTGARQYIANFPGVTVEKKEGRYAVNGNRFHIIDLPGTYSLTSYSLEERVARDFILNDKPDILLITVDASNLKRNPYLVFQIIEMERPTLLVLNMMDVARNRGIDINLEALEKQLGIPVIATVGNKGQGVDDLKKTINRIATEQKNEKAPDRLDYGQKLEPLLENLEEELKVLLKDSNDFPPRWGAVKLLEKDEEVLRLVEVLENDHGSKVVTDMNQQIESFKEEHGKSPGKLVAGARYKSASEIMDSCVNRKSEVSSTLTDKIDKVVLHRLGGPLILLAVLFSFYEVTMNLGTKLADWFFPYLNRLKEPIELLFGASSDLLRENLIYSLVSDGIVGGILSILYYVPIFLVLFTLIAVLEDSGYMTRVAFIMDRILRSFGLHGQSTLPLILGGVIVGGCAVPGVMATRAIKEDKARLITILIMPLMNCLAKIPFYILIVGMFFEAYQGLVLFSISIFTFLTALIVAKAFSRFLIKGEPAPFVMELPAYHLPTAQVVLRRTIERTWLFVEKVVTIILAVMVIVWFFVLFPGIGFEREQAYDLMVKNENQVMINKAGSNNQFSTYLQGPALIELNAYSERFRKEKRDIAGDKEELNALLHEFETENPDFLLLANNGKNAKGEKVKAAQKAAKALKGFQREIKRLKRDRKKELIDNSYAAAVGKFLEPITLAAGFNWKINVAVISTFAAKESLVGTLGLIYSVENDGDKASLSQTMKTTETGWTIWHALAILVLVALFPPCLATLIMIKTESQSYKWAIFAATYPIVLGFIIAMIIFQIGTTFI